MNKITVEDLVSLAMEIEIEDPIDWGMLAINEQEAYTLMASTILEKYGPYLEQEYGPTIFLATIIKLTVENFVLNLKIFKLMKKNV